ncbi:hypothetical protein VOLCADRAFT_77192, partial [Volvox carteri f. nagariensis]
MRQTVLNVVGSLPPQYFNVRITTMAESLAQLMLSIMTTGYMLRSAQFRHELQRSLKQLPAQSSASDTVGASAPTTMSSAAAAAALPSVAAFSPAELGCGNGAVPAASSGDSGEAAGGPGATFLYDGESSPYAPGVQKKNVEGEILRWHLARGEVERLAAADYIELLEREVAALRAQVVQVPVTELRPSPSPSSTPLATAGSVEVLGPDTDTAPLATPGALYPGQSLACVSPLPGFGERAGAGLPYGGGGSLAASGAG